MEYLHFHSLDEAISAIFGNNLRIVSKRPVYGGDINESYRLSLSDGKALFMKCNSPANISFFEAEAKGLNALENTHTINIPKVYGIGTDNITGKSFLLMEYLEASQKIEKYWEVFGHELAKLHRTAITALSDKDKNLVFGFEDDNYIGATPQKNTPTKNWVEFFRTCRLYPQIQMADWYFDTKIRKQFIKLMDNLESYLTEPEFPSLIHGDLWIGNAVCGPDGKAWILDPAAYVGHFEAELAMTELFGGYPDYFYQAYNDTNPINSGYNDRKDLYNLYHLLNHLNLFGSSYLGSVKRILDTRISI